MTDKLSRQQIQEVYGRILEVCGTPKAVDVAREFGVTAQSVHRWKTGVAAPDLEKLVLFCARKRISLDWLLTGKDETQERIRAYETADYPDIEAAVERSLTAERRELIKLLKGQPAREMQLLVQYWDELRDLFKRRMIEDLERLSRIKVSAASLGGANPKKLTAKQKSAVRKDLTASAEAVRDFEREEERKRE